MKFLSLVFLLTIAMAQDCKSRKNTETTIPEMNTSEVLPVIRIMKNPCFGKCPMYALTLYNNGLAEYVGRANVEKMGTFTKQIETEKVALLLQQFNAIGFWEMDAKYVSDLSDSQKTIITLMRKDSTKTVTGDHARPESLQKIEKMLVKIADSTEGWTKTKNHPSEPTEGNLPSYVIKNEIIANFEKDTDVAASVATKAAEGLSIKHRIAPNLDMWLLTFDTLRTEPTMMLRIVKKLPGVKGAEFNKQLKPREH
jgi:Domain of unknown function (DUF6438)